MAAGQATEVTGALDIRTEDLMHMVLDTPKHPLVDELMYSSYSFNRKTISAERLAKIFGEKSKAYEERYQREQSKVAP